MQVSDTHNEHAVINSRAKNIISYVTINAFSQDRINKLLDTFGSICQPVYDADLILEGRIKPHHSKTLEENYLLSLTNHANVIARVHLTQPAANTQ